jgi:integral membrane protein (TIGR01906 family)
VGNDITAQVGRSLAAIVVAAAAALVVVGASILVFLNPFWVGFEQIRTGATQLTAYSVADVHRVTDAILGELVFGPATFLQQVGGNAVFDPKERQHLADVRGVLIGVFVVVAIAIVVLAVAAWRARDRAWLWRSIAGGTATLAGAVVIVGALFALFFDAMFDVFHRLFFANGSYTFDPREERLVQLFPEDFWSETSIALAVVILIASLAVTYLALQRIAAAGEARSPASATGAAREGVA